MSCDVEKEKTSFNSVSVNSLYLVSIPIFSSFSMILDKTQSTFCIRWCFPFLLFRSFLRGNKTKTNRLSIRVSGMPRGSAKSEQPPDTRSPSTLPAHRNRVRCRTSGPLDMTRALPPRSLRRRCGNGCSRSCPEMLRRHSRIQRDEVEGPPPARILQRLRRRARLRCNRTLAPARQAPGTRSRRCTLA